MLPKPATPTSPMVTIVRPGTYDPEKYNIYDIFSVSIVIQNVICVPYNTLIKFKAVASRRYLIPGVLDKQGHF